MFHVHPPIQRCMKLNQARYWPKPVFSALCVGVHVGSWSWSWSWS